MGRNVATVLPATTGIINRFSSGGSSSPNMGSTTTGTEVLSGTGTGGTLATVLSLTGQGWCPFLICYSASITPTHTIRCQVTVDGVIIFDATSDSIVTTTSRGICVANAVPDNSTAATPSGYPIRYNASFVVKVASSQSGSDYVGVKYELSKT